MEKYTIVITETLTRKVEVFANSEDEALEKVEDMYDSEEIVLDYTDLDETTFNVD